MYIVGKKSDTSEKKANATEKSTGAKKKVSTSEKKSSAKKKEVKPPNRVIKTEKVKDMYKLNLSHSGVIKTCISVRKDKKNWITERASEYSLTNFNKRILRVFLTEILLAKGYKTIKAKLFVDIIVNDLKLSTHYSLISLLRGYVDDLAFRNRINFFIDRDINKTRDMLEKYMLEFKYKSNALDANYSKQEYMSMILNYLLNTLYKIRKYGLKEGKKLTVTRGINGVIKDLCAKEYNNYIYFFLFFDNSKPTLKVCKKVEASRKTDKYEEVTKENGVIYDSEITIADYETLFNLFVIKKMNKELYAKIIDTARGQFEKFIINKCSPFECLQIVLDDTMDNWVSYKLDNDLALYKISYSEVIN